MREHITFHVNQKRNQEGKSVREHMILQLRKEKKGKNW